MSKRIFKLMFDFKFIQKANFRVSFGATEFQTEPLATLRRK